MDRILLAVNGTLMRGLELECNMKNADAVFEYEARTEQAYRLWSIDDRNPAMIKVSSDDPKAVKVDVEVWSMPYEGLAKVLLGEPEGLCIGKVKLDGGEVVLGVVAEPTVVIGKKEISEYGGWRKYTASI